MTTLFPLWQILVFLAAAIVLSSAWGWVADKYELSGRGLTRRWYGTRAQVTLKTEADTDEPDRYTVLAWDDEDSAVPWLKVHKLSPEFLTYWDEDAEAFWAPVTDFAPYAVRRFRPGVRLAGRVPVMWLAKYPPLPYSIRVPEDVSDAA